MKNYRWVLLVVLGSCLNAVAQQKSTVDSLLKVLSTNRMDTSRVRTLLQLSASIYIGDPVKAFQYCKEALKISEKLDYNFGIAQSLAWLAYFHEQSGQIDTALLYYQRSLDIAVKTGNKNDAATCLNNIAAIYKDLGKIDEDLEFHQSSLRIKIEL